MQMREDVILSLLLNNNHISSYSPSKIKQAYIPDRLKPYISTRSVSFH